ncbi:MAG: hypothetical protein AB7N99_09565 [Simkaniaceae bacterium]
MAIPEVQRRFQEGMNALQGKRVPFGDGQEDIRVATEAYVLWLKGEGNPLKAQHDLYHDRVDELTPVNQAMEALEVRFPRAGMDDGRTLQQRLVDMERRGQHFEQLTGQIGNIQAIRGAKQALDGELQEVHDALLALSPDAGDGQTLRQRLAAMDGPERLLLTQQVADRPGMQRANGGDANAKADVVLELVEQGGVSVLVAAHVMAAKAGQDKGVIEILEGIFPKAALDDLRTLQERIQAVIAERQAGVDRLHEIRDLPAVQQARGTILAELQEVHDALLVHSPDDGQTLRQRLAALDEGARLVITQQVAALPGMQRAVGVDANAKAEAVLAHLEAGVSIRESVERVIEQAAAEHVALGQAQLVIQACTAIFGCQPNELEARINGANGPQLDQINLLPQLAARPEATTLEKIQAIIAIAGGVPALQGQVRDLQARAVKLDELADIENVNPNGKTQAQIDDRALNDARRERAINDELVEILREAFPKRALINYDQIDEAMADLRGRLQVVNRELSHVKGDHFDDKLVNHRRELVEEVTVSGTVMRIVNGVVNGLINTLYFAFVSLPKFCLGSLRFIGGIFVR